jgi:hypothetical protein
MNAFLAALEIFLSNAEGVQSRRAEVLTDPKAFEKCLAVAAPYPETADPSP